MSSSSPGHPDLQLRSATRGRERWLVRGLAGSKAFAARLEHEILSQPGILEVSANPVSSRVLIKFIPETPGLDIEQLLDRSVRNAAAYLREHGEETADSSPATVTAPGDGLVLRLIVFLGARKAPPGQEGAGSSAPLAEMLRIGIPEPRALLAPLVLSAVSQGLSLLRGQCFITIVNTARGEPPAFLRSFGLRNGPRFLFLSAVSFLVVAADYVLAILRQRSWHTLGEATTANLRNEIYAKIMAQDLEVFDRLSKTELTQAIDRDTHHIGQLVARVGDTLVCRGIILAVAVTSLFTASPALVGFTTLLVPLLLLPGRLLSGLTGQREKRLSEAEIELARTIDNSLANIVSVKSFSAERQEMSRFYERTREVATSSTEAYITSALQSRGVDAILVAGWYAMASYAGNLAAEGKIDQARFNWLLFLMPRLLSAPADLEEITRLYNRADRGARRLASILAIERRIESGPTLLEKNHVKGHVVFDRVSFGYAGSHPVLKDISFEIQAGQTFAIIGPTGSGKSTLLRLLMRFYDVDDGAIRIDGHDVRQLRIADLRAAIGLVTQEAFLFDGTIRDNVQYGLPGATEDEVLAALEAACALDVVERLPRGLDAPVGEHGRRLSGGQRQRIALARTLVKAAPILALDEATSQLDYETEAAIQQSLRREIAATKRSALVVAHRLATIRHADQILVLDDGRITERGVHDELVESGGLYQTLWELQVGASATDRPLEVRIRSGE